MFISEFFDDTNFWLGIVYSEHLLESYFFSIRIKTILKMTETGQIGLRLSNDKIIICHRETCSKNANAVVGTAC